MGKPLVWLFLACAVACKPSGTLNVDDTDATTTTEEDPVSPPIEDAPLFDAEHLLEVDVELEAADWLSIRNETRDFFEVLGGDCLAQPFESPFTYFEGTVTVDGEVIDTAGVRKKGFLGSMSWETPSLKIKTDTFVDDQYLENGTERLTLNNNVQDPSLINQCLGYSVFEAAGLPAPRCNFAVVTVNGEDLGVYTHVEAVKKDFLKRHFDDIDGDLYEGTLSDFYDGWTETFDPKTDDTDAAGQIVADIMDALDVPDDELLDSVGAIIDLPTFYKFWAVETLVAHWDGYAANQNNYYIYRDPSTDLVTFIPWGADALFSEPGTPAVFMTGWLTQRLWSVREAREAYVAAMEEVLDSAWDEDALLDELDRMQDLIMPHARDPQNTAIFMDFARTFIEERRGVIESQLGGLASQPSPEQIRDPLCFVDMGTVTSDFDTVYDTLQAEDPFIYGATLAGDTVPANLITGAVAGPDGYGGSVLATVGVTQDWTRVYQVVAPVPAGAEPGTYDMEFGTSYLVTADLTDPYDEGDIIGIILGSVTFTEVGENPGDPVVGTVSGTVMGGLF